jgi:hypothetical protein
VRPATARPTTRGLAPPPPPRHAPIVAESTQQIDIEQLEAMAEQAAARAADQTMELSPEHFVAIEGEAESDKQSKAERSDHTVPVRLDQILAIAPAKLRASVAPPAHPEPPKSHSMPANPFAPATSQDVTHAAAAKNGAAPQPTMFVEDEHATVPFPGANGAGGLPPPRIGALFGDLPLPNPSPRFGQSEAEADDSGAVQTIVAHRPGGPIPEGSFDHIVPRDDDATTALPPGGLSQHTLDDGDEPAPRGGGISDSLRPFLHGPLRDYRRLAIGVGAAAVAGLLFFSVKAMVRDDQAGELAQREIEHAQHAAPGAQLPAQQIAEPKPSVEPAPSVVALAAAPKGEEKAAPVSAEIPPPLPAPVVNEEPKPSAEPVPAAKLPSAKAAPESTSSGKLSREDKRRQKREERARAAAAQAAEKQAQKSAKQDKKGATSAGERADKATAARDEARDAYSAGNYKAAAQAYERAIQYDPSNVKLFAGLGMTRTKMRDLKGAAQAYERAVQLSPSSSVYHLSLGRLYAALGDKNKAKAAYKRALALDPKNASLVAELKALGG